MSPCGAAQDGRQRRQSCRGGIGRRHTPTSTLVRSRGWGREGLLQQGNNEGVVDDKIVEPGTVILGVGNNMVNFSLLHELVVN